MSRIGKRSLIIPQGVEVITSPREVVVKGPKGELRVVVPFGIVAGVKDGFLTTTPEEESKAKFLSPLLGLTNALVSNALIGVTIGFSKKLELSGVGYRAKKVERGLSMTLGFSHPVEFEIPAGINAEVEDNTKITISGIDKQLVGLMCAKIRKLKKPEPYKGKGIKYSTEVIRRKPGKAGKAQK
ncbi:50S ribosomal protein L6 [candidate division WWE3 bacterium CG08_land_8_20_14_0_20_41_10]|uniref:Large ribosomal subunit protein uL6 n=1 Tax=candidate division WWE3 bacterium CG08_land_8_20_14_0_20_41_10 TaxID=1975085 RepID=A0A2H0XBF8_UNCKA|nr:MAG: 50S ribosomal protein L6 [candidate division WWE3 bacterium CG08_land_8_20_14_0_20_41_10]